MKTLTLTNLSEELHGKLSAYAARHDLNIEEEAVRRLEQSIEEDAAVLSQFSDDRWKAIEHSLAVAARDSGSNLTGEDFQRYRNLALASDAR